MSPPHNHINAINPERIQWCCNDHRITVSDLAKISKIAQTTFTGMMEGKNGLTFNQLQKIARHFNRGVLFFLEQGPINDEYVYSSQFRTIANQKPSISTKVKSIIERVERQRRIFIDLREELGDIKRFNPPEMPPNDPKLAALTIREWLELSDTNDFNGYREAVESKGILVFRSNGYAGSWQIPKDDPVIGFSLYHQVYPVIVVKKQAAETRQTFTLMHELGHLLLHLKSRIDDNDDLYNISDVHEQEANAFAGFLLVPDEFLDQISHRDRPENIAEYDAWLRDKRNAWGVSGEVILRRLLDNRRITQKEYKDYRDWGSIQNYRPDDGGSRLWRHREPNHIFGSQFVTTVLDALSANYITLNKASSYLDNLKIHDLHKLEGCYASL